jgi:pyruvate, water dikinase
VTIVGLRDATEESRYGGKSVQLGAALRAGLPVPDGLALSVAVVEAIALGDESAAATAARAIAPLLDRTSVAVRSSAVGEDGAHASFAGQHTSCLGVRTSADVLDAVREVWQSGRSEAALAYRARMGVAGAPRVAVAVQHMVDPLCAGVMFTRDPRDGTDHRVIEAAWGLGEVVVAGLVTPDRVIMARGGRVLVSESGVKDVAIRMAAGGRTEEVPVEGDLVHHHCLGEASRLEALEALAAACEAVFPGAHDIEWAYEGARLFLLQRRAVTT